jgi:deoxyhypusine synthase
MKKEKTVRRLEKAGNLEPLSPIHLDKIDSFQDMLIAMRKTAFTGRQLGRAFDILHEMFTDRDTLAVMTMSGALTVAKQGQIICDLIDRGYIDIVIPTGALLTHGLIEGMGVAHYMSEGLDDKTAYEKGYNRVYDTIELELSFQGVEHVIGENLHRLLPALDGKTPPAGSADFCRRLGELCLEKYPLERSIFSSAAKAGIPIYIPAFTDCELAIEIGLQYLAQTAGYVKKPFDKALSLPYNPFVDMFDYAKRIVNHRGKLAIFTLGGGVPRNWAQQVAPLVDIMIRDGFPVERRVFSRGVRICPEPAHWGGLSGCTYSEGVSWGKFLPEEEGGRYAEVLSEVTAVLPLLIKALFERIDAGKKNRGRKSNKD